MTVGRDNHHTLLPQKLVVGLVVRRLVVWEEVGASAVHTDFPVVAAAPAAVFVVMEEGIALLMLRWWLLLLLLMLRIIWRVDGR